MLRLSSSLGLTARTMWLAPVRAMRPVPARARQMSTPSATDTTGKAAAFDVPRTGGRWSDAPEKFTKHGAAVAISYVFEGRGGSSLDGIFARADADRCEPNRTGKKCARNRPLEI